MPENKEIITIFENSRNYTNLTSESTYSLAGALLLSGKYMNDWWEITLSIFLWMSLSFMMNAHHALNKYISRVETGVCILWHNLLRVISLGATILSLFTLRKHPYVCFIPIPFIIMMFIIPFVFGAPTSMVLALAMYASKNAVSTWYCAIMGIIQTLLIFVTSVTRIHATL